MQGLLSHWWQFGLLRKGVRQPPAIWKAAALALELWYKCFLFVFFLVQVLKILFLYCFVLFSEFIVCEVPSLS